MEIAFDRTKDAKNRAKHGVSLALAAEFEWDTALTWIDTREHYGEERRCGVGYIGLRLFMVVFVDQAEGRRIISLGKATKTEISRYATS